MDTVGNRLSYARAWLKMNQSEFCLGAGISHQTYLSELENDNRPLSNKVAKAIENAFGISFDWLVDGNGEMLIGKDAIAQRERMKQHSGTPSQRLKMWRESKGFTQQELGELIGFTQSGIHAAENRDVSKNLANKLHMKCGLSFSWLMQGDGPMETVGMIDSKVADQTSVVVNPDNPSSDSESEIEELKRRIEKLELDVQLLQKLILQGWKAAV